MGGLKVGDGIDLLLLSILCFFMFIDMLLLLLFGLLLLLFLLCFKDVELFSIGGWGV